MPSLGLDLGTIVTASVPLAMITRRMISPRAMVCASATLTLLVISAASQEREKKIKRSDLPAAVQSTVTAQSQGATVRGFAEETANGQIYFEAQLKVSGHSKDVLMDPLGNIVEVEEEVALGTLPAAVKEGLLAQTASSKLVKIESLTKQGRLVAYEAQVITRGKKSEIQVGPDGKLLDHQE